MLNVTLLSFEAPKFFLSFAGRRSLSLDFFRGRKMNFVLNYAS